MLSPCRRNLLAALASLLASSFVMGGCSSAQLARSKAARLISECSQPDRAMRLAIGLETDKSWSSFKQICPMCETLESLGWVTEEKVSTDPKVIYPGGRPNTRFELTPQGRERSKNWPVDFRTGRQVWYSVPVTKRQLVEVSGITQVTQNDAAVEYSWKPVLLDPAFSSVPGIEFSEHKDEMSFRLYDDGWRASCQKGYQSK